MGDSARQVSRAQQDGAQSVADAQRALGEAAQAAGWAQEDAARGVADAQLGLQQAQQQAAWSNADAAQQVADAQRQLAEAYTDAGQAGVAGADATRYALDQLSPAGREFVRFWVNEWSPAVDRVTHATAEQMLPRVQTAMRNLIGLEPELTAGLSNTAAVLGDVAVRGSQLATSAPFRSDFASIMGSNANQLRSYGGAGLSMFGILTDLTAASGPYAEAFARNADYAAQAAESWVIGARASGELDTILRNGQATLDFLVTELSQIAGGLWDTAQGFVPLGAAALTALGDLSQFIGGVASWNPTLTSLVGGSALAAIGVGKLAAAMRVASATGWISGLSSAAGVLGSVLSPAALLATGKVQALGVATTSAATRVGLGATAATRLGTAVAGAAAGFPLAVAAVGGFIIATDALTVSQDEAVTALERGGRAAADTRAQIDKQNGTLNQNSTWVDRVNKNVNEWIGTTTGLWTTQDQAKGALDRYRSGMTDLQRAQSLAKEAQGDYELALAQTGPTSDRTVAAHDRLVAADGRVEQAQEDARRAIMSASDALRDQQDQMLAGLNARLQFDAAVRSTARAQDDYRRTLRETPNDAGAVADALNTLEQAQVRQFEAAQKAGEAQAKNKPGLDATAEGNRAAAQAVGQMVAATDGPLTGALADMVQRFDAGQLAAAGARVEIDKAGQSVAIFPNGKVVRLDANISPAAQRAAQLRDQINALVGTVRVDANGQPADESSRLLMERINSTIAQMKIAGDPGPGDGSLYALAQRVRATSEAMHVGGDTVPGQNDTEALKRYVAAQWAKINDAANTDPARLDTLARMGWVNQQWAKVNVGAETRQMGLDVGRAIQGLPGISPLTPINLFYRMNPVGRAPGDLSPRAYAGGGLVGYAGGGRIGADLNPVGFPTGGRVGGRPAGAARPHGRDDTVIAARRGEFMIRDNATGFVGTDALGVVNGVSNRRDGEAVRRAVLGIMAPGAAQKPVQGMAGGGLAGVTRPVPVRPVGAYAGGGAVALAPHRYDLAASIASRPTPMAVDVEHRSAGGGVTNNISQTFAADQTAREGFSAASRAIALGSGGVHNGDRGIGG